MGIRTALVDAGSRALSAGHRGLLALTRGRVGWSLGTLQMVELHTVGRTSGRRRSIMLMSPIQGDGRYLLVASKGGDDRHPLWYLNLVANPAVELTVRGGTMPMRARTATAAERAELWPRIVAAYPNYARYQRRTSREIPVVICEPR
ncbi:nitroreductase/quinone reductase family protein [Glaciibacter sp. 2TAF33]|uniref:nitroreductase/quinone reductase family protein n=1 Tax=Glaciibacter sp. 2TAF33 TaxID=3233015 RepID=UPI003F91F2DD